MRVLASLILSAGVFAFASAPATAAQFQPSSGFLATYGGPQNGDLAITGGEALLGTSAMRFTGTFAAPVNTTVGGPVIYVWGVDRGADIAPFGAFRPGVLWDAAVVAVPSAHFAEVIDLFGATTPLPAGDLTFSGNDVSLLVPLALLPSTGDPASQYLVNLWTRFGANPADLTQLAQFAPPNGDVAVSAPEPATILIAGGVLAFAARRRRKRVE